MAASVKDVLLEMFVALKKNRYLGNERDSPSCVWFFPYVRLQKNAFEFWCVVVTWFRYVSLENTNIMLACLPAPEARKLP